MDTALTEQEQTKQIIENPQELFNLFRQSSFYQEAYHSRLATLKITHDVTETEVRESFENSESAKEAFFSFIKEGGYIFHYNNELYPHEFLKLIDEYLRIRKGFKNAIMSRPGEDTMDIRQRVLEYDRCSFRVHNEAGRVLVKFGIAPSEQLGRVLVSLIAMEKRLKTLEESEERESIRNKRAAIGR